MSNSARELKAIQKMNNKITLQLQKLANQNTAKTFKFNSQEAAITRDFNRQEAATARQWQTEMSNTAHQREVADLKKAGLNPVLSANSGAQSYTTSSASASNASGTADNSAVMGLANLKSQETAARSSMYGADQSLRASQFVASAQRYAADRAYQSALASAAAQRYAADKHYEGSVYVADKNYAAVMDKPQGTWASIVDKYLGKSISSGVKEMAKDSTFNSKITGVSRKEVQKYAGEPNAYAALSATGQRRVNAFLKTHGYVVSASNAALVASFLLSGSIKYLKRLSRSKSYITRFG